MTQRRQRFLKMSLMLPSQNQKCATEGKGAFPVIMLVHGGGFAFENQRMSLMESVAKKAIRWESRRQAFRSEAEEWSDERKLGRSDPEGWDCRVRHGNDRPEGKALFQNPF